MTTGKKLYGEDAPLMSQLQAWLQQNPGWEIADTDDEDEDDDEDKGILFIILFGN